MTNTYKTLVIYLILCCFHACTETGKKKILKVENKDTLIQLNIETKVKIIDSVLNKNKDISDLWETKGKLYFQLQKTDSALFSFEKALQLNPKNYDVMITLAYIYAENKNKRSLDLCQSVLKTNKKQLTPKAYYIQGVYYSSVGNFPKAIENYTACIKKDWTFVDAYLEKGILLLKSKNTEEAINVFILAIKVNNKNSESYYWYGRALEQKGLFEKAQFAYKQSVQLDPSFQEAKRRIKKTK